MVPGMVTLWGSDLRQALAALSSCTRMSDVDEPIWVQAVRKNYAAVAKYATFNEALRQDIQTTPPPPTSIGAHLLKIKDPKTNAPLSDDQLQGELTSLYMAGKVQA